MISEKKEEEHRSNLTSLERLITKKNTEYLSGCRKECMS